MEIKDFTRINPLPYLSSAIVAIFRFRSYRTWYSNRITSWRRGLPARIWCNESRKGSVCRGGAFRRNYTTKLHRRINPRALIATSLRDRKLSAINENQASSVREKSRLTSSLSCRVASPIFFNSRNFLKGAHPAAVAAAIRDIVFYNSLGL